MNRDGESFMDKRKAIFYTGWHSTLKNQSPHLSMKSGTEGKKKKKKEKTKGIQEAYPPNRLVQCLCEYLLSNLEQYSC